MKPVHPQDIWKRQLWQLQILQIRPGEPPYFQMEKKNEPQKRPEIDDNNWCAMTLTHILNSLPLQSNMIENDDLIYFNIPQVSILTCVHGENHRSSWNFTRFFWPWPQPWRHHEAPGNDRGIAQL